jgi:Zn-dependent membrane protease YugP
MHMIIILLLLFGLLYGPSLWVRQIMNRHRRGEEFSFSGSELAERLLKELKIEDVRVETTPHGDHYDPQEKRVRLNPRNHQGRNLTAITIAAHEVGHALQHARGERPFQARQDLVLWSMKIQRIGGFIMLAAPFMAILTRHPVPPLILFLVGLATLGSAALVHFLTLPVELDASFNKALPLLKGIVPKEREPAARGILKAAAYTYVAGSLASLLNVWRWFRLMRR